MTNIALILAAGKGTRFESPFPKQLVPLNGKAILTYSLDIVENMSDLDMTMLVIDLLHKRLFREIADKYKKRIEMCPGGSTRQQSVYNGLKYIKKIIPQTDTINVLIHDSARPFATTVFKNVLSMLKKEEAVVPVIKPKDTNYLIEDQKIVNIPCREHLFHVQTPQGFSFPTIFDCHKLTAEKQMNTFTDDGSLYYKLKGKSPTVVDGDQMNFKITNKKDLMLAAYYLSKEKTS
ncbi:MAG: 2-C-methyl-D-erythritol 4-phosphate cytidylyltransferase [Thermotogota bacterium]